MKNNISLYYRVDKWDRGDSGVSLLIVFKYYKCCDCLMNILFLGGSVKEFFCFFLTECQSLHLESSVKDS